MILCSSAPTAIIKGVLLAHLQGDLPCLKGDEHSLGLFAMTEAEDADKASLPNLLDRLTARGIDAGWLRGTQGQHLCSLIAGNLRYTAPDKAALAFAAVEEALLQGPEYCLNSIGDISRLFWSRYRAVTHEVHKMTGFVRFHPAGEAVLAARPKLYHDTADLLLRQLAPRYPNTRLVFLLPDGALAIEAGRIFPVAEAAYGTAVDNDPFTASWERYYQSQYIATRKNISLAQKFLPKKYWATLSEGKFLAAEAAK